MTALSGGHLAVDFASGSVPALIPFLTDRFDLNYALAAMLLLASTVSSSLVQPLFGLWSDRRGALWLIPGGTILAAVGVGLAAVTPWYPLVLVLVFAGGLGVAAFHPEGAKYAAYASGRKRASGMSYFNIGGNTGYALGAFVTGLLVAAIGLGGGLLAMVPVAVAPRRCSRVHCRTSRRSRRRRRATAERARGRPPAGDGAARRRDRAPQRRVVHAARVRPALGRLARALEGVRQPAALPDAARRRASGRSLLGPVADRIGLRRTLVVTQALIPPLMLVFVYVGGIAGARGADARRRVRRRHLRCDDGAEPALPAAAHRHGVRPLGRSRDGIGGSRPSCSAPSPTPST